MSDDCWSVAIVTEGQTDGVTDCWGVTIVMERRIAGVLQLRGAVKIPGNGS